MTEELINALTTELTREEVIADPNWTTKGICITTSNLDRSVLNATMAEIFANMNGEWVIRWKRTLVDELPHSLESMIYNQNKYPELFGFFVVGAPSQILDNGNGNVCFGVANGTPCKMVSLGWSDPKVQSYMNKYISQITQEAGSIVDIPITPEYIIVEVDMKEKSTWPKDLNISDNPNVLHIPIGFKSRQDSNKNNVRLANHKAISYKCHAVDLAFALTTWKSQGGTFEYVTALLESSPNSPSLTYELLYVMFSRVKEGKHFRCMPFGNGFSTRRKLRQLRPNIYATRWRMDIGKNGYWQQSDEQLEATNMNIRKRKIPKAKQAEMNRNKRAKTSLDGTQTFSVQTQVLCFWEKAKNKYSKYLQGPSTAMSFTTGLPIGHMGGEWHARNFTNEGLKTLLPGQWIDNDVIDLFAALETNNSLDKFVYLPSEPYSFFCANLQLGNLEPDLVHDDMTNAIDLLSKPMWLILINHENQHWQLLVIMHPGLPSTFALLLDPLINQTRPICKPSNFQNVHNFAKHYVSQVLRRANSGLGDLVPEFVPTLHSCLVPSQPNGYDCGLFTLLNLKYIVANVDEVTNCLLDKMPSQETDFVDFSTWFDANWASQHQRQFFFELFVTLLEQFSDPLEET